MLYCLNNETGERVEWGDYWAAYLRQRAASAGVTAQITDMRRSENVRSPDHAHIFDRPELYDFVDISQNNAWAGRGQGHYDNILFVRERLAQRPRPINNNKNYGAARHGEEESVARFCRIVFAGGASVPHPLEDPGSHEAATEFGLGLSPRAQKVIASMRQVADRFDVFAAAPRNDLLSERSPNEAYCLAQPGRQYAVYFPDGGQVKLDVSAAAGPLSIGWLDLRQCAWQESQTVPGGGVLELKTPGPGHWVALLQPSSGGAGASRIERLRPWPDNPHYLAWGDTPVFPLGAAGYHSWTPISRPAEMDFQKQLDRLAEVVRPPGWNWPAPKSPPGPMEWNSIYPRDRIIGSCIWRTRKTDPGQVRILRAGLKTLSNRAVG